MSQPAKKPKLQNKKKYYQTNNRRQYLEAGHKGFIATCNFNEKDCIRECYNILNQYANDLYGPEERPETNPTLTVDNKEEDLSKVEEQEEADIADQLQKQIDDTQQKSKSFAKRRFQVVDTGATNCVFIKTTLSDPIVIADHIIKDIAETKKQKTRYLLRLVPVEIVCKANTKDIVNSAGQLCDKYFLNEPTTFSIVFNKRFNNDLSRDALIKELADIIHAKNVKHKVDLKYAKKSLVVEVIKGLCCLSVVDDYMAMKKYNLVELARSNQEYDSKQTKDGEGSERKPLDTEKEKLTEKDEVEAVSDGTKSSTVLNDKSNVEDNQNKK